MLTSCLSPKDLDGEKKSRTVLPHQGKYNTVLISLERFMGLQGFWGSFNMEVLFSNCSGYDLFHRCVFTWLWFLGEKNVWTNLERQQTHTTRLSFRSEVTPVMLWETWAMDLNGISLKWEWSCTLVFKSFDLYLRQFHGLYLHMGRDKRGFPSDQQDVWLERNHRQSFVRIIKKDLSDLNNLPRDLPQLCKFSVNIQHEA